MGVAEEDIACMPKVSARKPFVSSDSTPLLLLALAITARNSPLDLTRFVESIIMSTCGPGTRNEDYNLPLHIGALFIVLGVSAGACALPVVAISVPQLNIPAKILFVFRHFGTGVLLATAFVHLLPTAFVSLTHPCLPAFFKSTYPALAGAIALGSVFLITIAEMIFSPGRSLCSGPIVNTDTEDVAVHSPDRHVMEFIDQKEAQRRMKLLTQCVLLECGILFHSIFIGMALAVSAGGEQIVLLIALSFHQCFEGLALGSRIAAVGWEARAAQPWLMAFAYGCTTPLGQAIGIATRNRYDPDSQTGLILVGTMNAISAGLLTYTSLVDLLSEDFLSDSSWRTLQGSKRILAMSFVFAGAFCMSLIGAWA